MLFVRVGVCVCVSEFRIDTEHDINILFFCWLDFSLSCFHMCKFWFEFSFSFFFWHWINVRNETEEMKKQRKLFELNKLYAIHTHTYACFWIFSFYQSMPTFFVLILVIKFDDHQQYNNHYNINSGPYQ